MDNLSLVYNKTMYDHDGEFGTRIRYYVDNIIGTTFNADNDFQSLDIPGLTTFTLKTSYPGILMGTGYSHGISTEQNQDAANEDIKVGFSFDYVSGLPYIPGSSIKGVLKSVFAYPEVIAEMLASTRVKAAFPDGILPEVIVPQLTQSIFGDKDESSDGDIFFDAVIKSGNKEGKFLAEDYITHHSNPIKDPIPIKILKVLPDVEFEFRFILNDSTIKLDDEKSYILTANKKEKLFKYIITEFGIGAKTNVGYGRMKNVAQTAPTPQEDPNRTPNNSEQNNQTIQLTDSKIYKFKTNIRGSTVKISLAEDTKDLASIDFGKISFDNKKWNNKKPSMLYVSGFASGNYQRHNQEEYDQQQKAARQTN